MNAIQPNNDEEQRNLQQSIAALEQSRSNFPIEQLDGLRKSATQLATRLEELLALDPGRLSLAQFHLRSAVAVLDRVTGTDEQPHEGAPK